jgi:hypothetical protein
MFSPLFFVLFPAWKNTYLFHITSNLEKQEIPFSGKLSVAMMVGCGFSRCSG